MTHPLLCDESLFPHENWWYLFIDKRHHNRKYDVPTTSRYKGTYDAEPKYYYDHNDSPGHYSAMMSTVGEYVFTPNALRLDFDTYEAIHGFIAKQGNEVVQDAITKLEEYEKNKIRSRNAFGSDRLPKKCLTEMAKKKILGRSLLQEKRLIYQNRRLKTKLGPCVSYIRKINNYDYEIVGNYDATSRKERARYVDAIFDEHYDRIAQSSTDRERVEIIADTVRSLHVGHFFGDGNGRLNMPIIMNKLLCDQGLVPAILPDGPGVFGGEKTVAELSDDMIEGMKDFLKTCAKAPVTENSTFDELNKRINSVPKTSEIPQPEKVTGKRPRFFGIPLMRC